MNGTAIFRDGQDRIAGTLPVRAALRPVRDHLAALAWDTGVVFVWSRRVAPDRSGCSRWPWFAVGARLPIDEAQHMLVAGEA